MIASGAQTHPAVWTAAALLAATLGARAFEQMNVFRPQKEIYAHPGTYGLKYEDVWLTADDGARVNAWWVPLPGEGPVVLYFHGNGGNIGTRLDMVKRLREAGASVLLFDYRGYGRSPGTPTEAGTYRDGEAAYAWLVAEKRVEPRKIFFLGESLGNGVALELALRHAPAGLIFQSGFTSIVDMGRVVFPFLPAQFMTRYRYDNIAKIGKLRCPLLVMHSPQDEVIPFAMGRRVFDAAPEPKAFFALTGRHNDGFMLTGGAYVQALRSFFASISAARI